MCFPFLKFFFFQSLILVTFSLPPTYVRTATPGPVFLTNITKCTKPGEWEGDFSDVEEQLPY